jgi:hypothetical protein
MDNKLFIRIARIRASLLLTALVVLSVTTAQAQTDLQLADRVSAERLTNTLLDLNTQYQAAAPAAKTELLGKVVDAAMKRQRFLSSIIARNPSEVLRVAIPATIGSSLPPSAKTVLEKEVDLKGELEVMIEDGLTTAKLHHFLNTGTERVELHFSGEPPTDLLTGAIVRVHGTRMGSEILLDSPAAGGGTSGLQTATTTTSTSTAATVLPNTFGQKNVLVIMVNFQDNPTAQPYTASYVQNLVFSQTSNWFMENSFQQTWLTGDVAGWFTVAVDSTNCATGTIKSDAQAAAQAAGFNLANYSRFIYLLSSNTGCSAWWGYATIGGSDVWINGEYQLAAHVVAHEEGHNYGLYHAHTNDCGTAVVCTSGSFSDYGDWIDVMGYPSYTAAGHYGAFQKERLGWLNYGTQPPLTTVTTNGTYQLGPYETQDGTLKALKILKSSSSGSYYYVEYRQAVGVDSFLSAYSDVLNGLVLHLATPSNANSDDLLDMTPSSPSSFSHPALVAGSSYTDSTAGVTITPSGISSTGATVQVTFGPLTCVHANPTVSISPSQSQWVTAGTAVSFTFSVTNNDNSGCSTSTFNLGVVVPSGWSSAMGNTLLNLAPGTSASTTFQVTSPAGAANGFYSVGVSATNSSASSYAASASATYVIAALSISISTNQASYSRGQTVNVTVSLMSGSSADSGASVTVNITKASGSVVTLTGTTGSNGSAVVSYRLKKTDPVGTYQASGSSNAGANSATVSASTSFGVQ